MQRIQRNWVMKGIAGGWLLVNLRKVLSPEVAGIRMMKFERMDAGGNAFGLTIDGDVLNRHHITVAGNIDLQDRRVCFHRP